MRALILSITAAAVLALGFAPQTASAAWTYRTVSRYDPVCNKYVSTTEKVWVPDVVAMPPVVTYSPVWPQVVVRPAPVVVYPDYDHHHHHHHHHHD